MKKLSLYVFLGLFVFNSAYAEVYYCVDGSLTGFNSKAGNYGVYDEDSANFKPKRFTANINFEKLQFTAEGINGFFKFESSGKIHFSAECKKGYTDQMICVSKDNLFKIDKNNLEYVRSINHGGGDTILIGYGRCEKF